MLSRTPYLHGNSPIPSARATDVVRKPAITLMVSDISIPHINSYPGYDAGDFTADLSLTVEQLDDGMVCNPIFFHGWVQASCGATSGHVAASLVNLARDRLGTRLTEVKAVVCNNKGIAENHWGAEFRPPEKMPTGAGTIKIIGESLTISHINTRIADARRYLYDLTVVCNDGKTHGRFCLLRNKIRQAFSRGTLAASHAELACGLVNVAAAEFGGSVVSVKARLYINETKTMRVMCDWKEGMPIPTFPRSRPPQRERTLVG